VLKAVVPQLVHPLSASVDPLCVEQVQRWLGCFVQVEPEGQGRLDDTGKGLPHLLQQGEKDVGPRAGGTAGIAQDS
jgi:hypothetical protein